MGNADDQIADIRERVASIETKVTYLQRAMDVHAEEAHSAKGGGNIVIPVAAVITVLEIVKAVIERLA